MAGLAAMFLAYVLGSSMGLNDTATFMASCVAFVAVALWTDSRLARRRRQAARAAQARREAAREHTGGDHASRDASSLTPDAESRKRDGRAG